MNIPPINLKAQFKKVEKEVLRNLKEILSEQRLILGRFNAELEERIAAFTGVPYAIACANGTDALILSLMALEIGPGDEVITTPYTFFATASSVALMGARPVFVDVEPEFMNIDPDLIEAAITPRTKAIIVVHLFGKLCAMDRIMKIARKHRLAVVEDMAQSLGASRNGRSSGSFGDIAAVSFYPTKNLGGIGEGGMVLTTKKGLAERTRKLRVHGMGSTPYQHDLIGINSRLDEIKAAALVAKLPLLDAWNKKRIANARLYNRRFTDLPLTLPPVTDETSHIFHHYVIRTDRRDELQTYLRERGILTGVYYPVPLHLQRCFRSLGYRKGMFPVSEKAAATSLSVPVYPELTAREQRFIVASIREFFS
jgi:dTDP-4-amino-4,6-dideoxygalactose transaminase